jgi:ribosomal protein S12 methylthiotransferase accessory factor
MTTSVPADELDHTAGMRRGRTPEQTLDRVMPLRRTCGITRLARLTGLDDVGIPVFAAVRPLARSLVISLGKGVTDSAAKASALLESIEIWHAERVRLPARRGTATSVSASVSSAGHRVLPVHRLPAAVGRRLDPRAEMSWVAGAELGTRDTVWVPADIVSLDFTTAGDSAASGLLRSSNGLASGNTTTEAIIHALCEVIERDAEALWRRRSDYARVDPDTVTDPHCRELIATLRAADVHVLLWDVTSDVGVPTFGCLLTPDPAHGDMRAVGVHDGFGTHLRPAIALSRALTEAAQNRLTYISGSRDDLSGAELRRAADPGRLARVTAELAGIPFTRDFGVHRPPDSATLADDLGVIRERLRDAGFGEVVVIDLAHEELGVPVVKVVVPGLEARFGDSAPGPRALAAR